MDIPTAEEILSLLIPHKQNVSEKENLDALDQNKNLLIDWCKLHVETALKVAELGAKASIIYTDYNDFSKGVEGAQVDSIGEYSLENIK